MTKLIGILHFKFQVPPSDSVVQLWHTPEPIFVPASAADDHGIMDLEPPGPLNSGSICSRSWFDPPTRSHPFRSTHSESGQPSASLSGMVLDVEAIEMLKLEGENVHDFLAVDFD